jgi:hypothetical protein
MGLQTAESLKSSPARAAPWKCNTFTSANVGDPYDGFVHVAPSIVLPLERVASAFAATIGNAR